MREDDMEDVRDTKRFVALQIAAQTLSAPYSVEELLTAAKAIEKYLGGEDDAS